MSETQCTLRAKSESGNHLLVPVEVVKRAKDAEGFLCLTCGDYRDDYDSWPPWGWRKSQHLHESGNKGRVRRGEKPHSTVMFRYERAATTNDGG